MTEQGEIKVLRAVRFELDPTVGGSAGKGSPQVHYSRLDIVEIELPDGSTDVIAAGTSAGGSSGQGPGAGSDFWARCGTDFDAAVALNESKERALGAVLSGPTVLVPEGSPVVQPGPGVQAFQVWSSQS